MATNVAIKPGAVSSARQARGFAGSVCVVFDVLCVSSVIVTGLANGACGFIPFRMKPDK
jgi:phosphosulfolactate phosphohydrolase-like enzyme